MEIIIECLPIAVLTACLIYLCVKGKKGYLFVLALVYIVLNVAYKVISFVCWPNIDEESMYIYNVIGAIATVVNYALMLLVFIHIMKNSKKPGNKKAVDNIEEGTDSRE